LLDFSPENIDLVRFLPVRVCTQAKPVTNFAPGFLDLLAIWGIHSCLILDASTVGVEVSSISSPLTAHYLVFVHILLCYLGSFAAHAIWCFWCRDLPLEAIWFLE
jgi:hypothetical protein